MSRNEVESNMILNNNEEIGFVKLKGDGNEMGMKKKKLKAKDAKKGNFRQVVISGKEFERIVYCDDRHYHFNPRRHTLTALDGIKSWTSVLLCIWALWAVIIIHTTILSHVFDTQFHYYLHSKPKELITYIVFNLLTVLHGIFIFYQV